MSPTILSRSLQLRQKSTTATTASSSSISKDSTKGVKGQTSNGEQGKKNGATTHPESTPIKFTGDKSSNTPNRKANREKLSDNQNSPMTTAAISRKGAKSSRSSPFRIKVGCVVAVRYRPSGNRVTLASPAFSPGADGGQQHTLIRAKEGKEDAGAKHRSSLSFSEVWTDPQPGRDAGLALIGRRIRCCFPASVMSRKFQDGKKPTSRILEGEIVSILNYSEQFQKNLVRRRNREKSCYGTLVELLIEQDRLTALPFLKRTDPVVDISKLSDSARRGHLNEERIRGKGKAIVEVTLADSFAVASAVTKSSGNNNGRTKSQDEVVVDDIVARWVVRKRVPMNLPIPTLPSPSPEDDTTDKKKGQLKNTDKMQTSNNTTATAKGTGGDSACGANDTNPNSNENSNSESQLENNNDCNGENPYTLLNDKIRTSNIGEDQPPKKKRRRTIGTKEVSGAPRYVGDGNDQSEHQEKNWRWQAGRYNNTRLLSERPLPLDYLEMLSYGLMVGEVTNVQPAAPSSSTLAIVTIKRLILPEHTRGGRLPHHGAMDMYDDRDSVRQSFGSLFVNDDSSKSADCQDEDSALPIYYQFPMEELIILSRRVKRNFDVSSEPNVASSVSSISVMEPVISFSYGLAGDCYYRLSKDAENSWRASSADKKSTGNVCHRCRKIALKVVTKVRRDSTCAVSWCKPCVRVLKRIRAAQVEATEKSDDLSPTKTEWTSYCDCDECSNLANSHLQKELMGAIGRKGVSAQQQQKLIAEDPDSVSGELDRTAFLSTRAMLRITIQQPVDFGLPPSFLPRTTPSNKPISKVKAKAPKKVKKSSIPTRNSASTEKAPPTAPAHTKAAGFRRRSPTSAVFQPTSSRLLAYNTAERKFFASAFELYPWTSVGEDADHARKDKPRNLRQSGDGHAKIGLSNAGDKDGKILNGRALRANQRRLMRDVAAMGLGLDSLAGREQQLRFDRSGIHAWGVFADVDIREGEMLIEYRGEIIGNVMAEKREKEYEAAKIGSDYMFRIDDIVVCDATKQGNVARFINASCDPNCYTKIISIDGSKRIVIYAKRDIAAGEELCYDYKFPLEYDESKRIPCFCRAEDCRGFMNWDKKYVALPESEAQGKESKKLDSSGESATGGLHRHKRLKQAPSS